VNDTADFWIWQRQQKDKEREKLQNDDVSAKK
jgi:hypothetical protein